VIGERMMKSDAGAVPTYRRTGSQLKPQGLQAFMGMAFASPSSKRTCICSCRHHGLTFLTDSTGETFTSNCVHSSSNVRTVDRFRP